jgi:hypothetical protein
MLDPSVYRAPVRTSIREPETDRNEESHSQRNTSAPAASWQSSISCFREPGLNRRWAELDDAVDEAFDEVAVMVTTRARFEGEGGLEGLPAGQIEVVGGLVEEEKVGAGEDEAGEVEAAALP